MLKVRKKPSGSVSFTSGLLQGLDVERGRIIKRNAGFPVGYGDQTVGFNRFFTAQQAGVQIARTCSVPFESDLRTGQYLEMVQYRDGKTGIYKIEQIQEKADSAPPSLLLSLSETLVTFEDQRAEADKVVNL